LSDVGYLGGAPVEVSAVSFEMKPIPRKTCKLTIANSKRAFIEAWTGYPGKVYVSNVRCKKGSQKGSFAVP
jgi:hypothetical protein